MKEKTRKTRSGSLKKIGILLILLLFLSAVGGFVWAYNNYQQAKEKLELMQKQGQQQIDQKRQEKLVKKLKKHMVLPEETPSVVSITNPDRLAERETFFKKAKEGDILFLYPQKAILYRPDVDKLVEVQPVVRANNTSTRRRANNTNNEQNSSLRLDVRNGTDVANQANKLAEEIGSNDKYNIVNVGDAASSTYKQSLIVNLSDKSVARLKALLGAAVTTELPDNEKPTDADVVIILGTNNIKQTKDNN